MPEIAVKSSTPLVNLLEQIAAERELQPGTVATYRLVLERLDRRCGLVTVAHMAALRPKDVDALQRTLRKQASPATTRLSLSVAKLVWKWLFRQEALTNSPFVAMEGVKVGNNVPEWNVLLPGETERLVAWIEARSGRKTRRKWLALVMLLVGQGLRVHEALALTWGKIRDIDGKHVLVFRGKGGKEGRMVLRADVWAAVAKLKRQDKRLPGEKLFKMTRFGAHSLVRRASMAALGKKVTPHGLRATFVSAVIAKHGIEVARQAARHSSVATTQRYSRWNLVDAEALK